MSDDREAIVEYSEGYAGGAMLVRPAKEWEDVYPLEKWMEYKKAGGGRVYRRSIIVVSDWEEI